MPHVSRRPWRQPGRDGSRGDRGTRAEPVYLPPYSPDLNPNGQLFATLTALLRKAAARTVDTLRAAIGALPGSFEPDEGAAYLRRAGDGSTRSEAAPAGRRRYPHLVPRPDGAPPGLPVASGRPGTTGFGNTPRAPPGARLG